MTELLHQCKSRARGAAHLLFLTILGLTLSACVGPKEPVLLPSRPAAQSGEEHPHSKPVDPPRELTIQELQSFPTKQRKLGPQGRFWGYDVLGTYKGHRFVAQYICSDVCPDYTVTVYHFIDLRSGEACVAIGASWEGVRVPYSIGTATRGFCMAPSASKRTP